MLRVLLLNLQKIILPRRVLINRIFLAVEILLIAAFAGILVKTLQDYSSMAPLLFEVGGKLGEIAVGLYALTLIPGIITRLQVLPQLTQPVAGMLLPFRRHLGILMFLCVYVHMEFTTFFHLLIPNNFDTSKIQLLLFQQIGFAAWLLLLPLWLTSNDFSQKRLGRWWKRLHRLTYIALFLIFMHTALVQTNWMLVMGVVGILEIASWIKVWMKRPQAPAPVATSPQTFAQKLAETSAANSQK